MAHCFHKFFCQNILNTHIGFPPSTLSQGKPLVEESCMSMMDTFEPFTEAGIRQLLKKSSKVFCAVDPMPTWFLDLSAAFDTVDHNVLFSRLKYMFGLSGKVLEWFRSYLEQHYQRESVHGILSDIQFLLPKGSVLGPLVFTMYTCPLVIIAQR